MARDKVQSDPLGLWGWIALAALAGFLIGAIVYAIHAWNALPGVEMSPLGWVFMGLGAFVTFVVGAGLMALLFYSSRSGKDLEVNSEVGFPPPDFTSRKDR